MNRIRPVIKSERVIPTIDWILINGVYISMYSISRKRTELIVWKWKQMARSKSKKGKWSTGRRDMKSIALNATSKTKSTRRRIIPRSVPFIYLQEPWTNQPHMRICI
jgi:hypothetical protein